MTRTIAVVGSTGQQGGAVVYALLKANGWKVRGITRNTSSQKAKGLAAQGVDMVAGDIDDTKSLGVQAIFGVTNFWEHLGQGLDADAAGEKEAEQAFNIASAASQISTLEHYLFSTLPKARELSKGQRPVPHMDHKAGVDDRIRKELPNLAAKTTFVWLGWYAANMASFPLVRPFELPLSGGNWIWIQPSPADACLPICGDVKVNLGTYVRAALDHPEKSLGKYVNVRTDRMTFTEILKLWSSATGKHAQYIPVSIDAFESLWGPYGREMALQYFSGELWPDWDELEPSKMCSRADLLITDEDLVNLKGEFELLETKLSSA
ncbi:hypothetical protein KC354_g2092 [Hortaea werneckii]|uniref:NmrA-like domain-containing protein n=1 Tax=Hortaea werneckii TaxID=91943 RepID=A0A3M7EDJ4_HORWE|nr:hypothetical protein KC354_g2092 [Hortaea werneckii]RMY74490.1 hypothetical protein D0863_03199 [Hortaea werneckii]